MWLSNSQQRLSSNYFIPAIPTFQLFTGALWYLSGWLIIHSQAVNFMGWSHAPAIPWVGCTEWFLAVISTVARSVHECMQSQVWHCTTWTLMHTLIMIILIITKGQRPLVRTAPHNLEGSHCHSATLWRNCDLHTQHAVSEWWNTSSVAVPVWSGPTRGSKTSNSHTGENRSLLCQRDLTSVHQ